MRINIYSSGVSKSYLSSCFDEIASDEIKGAPPFFRFLGRKMRFDTRTSELRLPGAAVCQTSVESATSKYASKENPIPIRNGIASLLGYNYLPA